jgi:hypothetical protein
MDTLLCGPCLRKWGSGKGRKGKSKARKGKKNRKAKSRQDDCESGSSGSSGSSSSSSSSSSSDDVELEEGRRRKRHSAKVRRESGQNSSKERSGKRQGKGEDGRTKACTNTTTNLSCSGASNEKPQPHQPSISSGWIFGLGETASSFKEAQVSNSYTYFTSLELGEVPGGADAGVGGEIEKGLESDYFAVLESGPPEAIDSQPTRCS